MTVYFDNLTIEQLSALTLDELSVMELFNSVVSIYPVTAYVISVASQSPGVTAYLVSATAEATVEAELVTITFIDSWS